MRGAELMDAEVVDDSGASLGVVRDLRLRNGSSGFEVTGVVYSPRGVLSAAAHSWGFGAGRTDGPALLQRVAALALRSSVFVPADSVTAWGAGRVEIQRGAGVRWAEGGAPR